MHFRSVADRVVGHLGLEGDEGAEDVDDIQRCSGGTGRYLLGRINGARG